MHSHVLGGAPTYLLGAPTEQSSLRWESKAPSISHKRLIISIYILLSSTSFQTMSNVLLGYLAATGPDSITFSSQSAEDLVKNYFLDQNDPVKIRNIASSSHSCFALFANGHSAGQNADTNEFLLPDEGIILSTGNPQDFHMNDSDQTSTSHGLAAGDLHMEDIWDQCFIQFDFSCPKENLIYAPQLTFNYVFGSEETEEKKHDADALGFYLNGHVLFSDKKGKKVNEKRKFVDNKATVDEFGSVTSVYDQIEADRFTSKLTATGTAKSGWNTVKITIGDVGDGNLDSWLLLEAGSFSCELGDVPKSLLHNVLFSVAIFFMVLVTIVVGVWGLYKCGVLKKEDVKKIKERVKGSSPVEENDGNVDWRGPVQKMKERVKGMLGLRKVQPEKVCEVDHKDSVCAVMETCA